jgi:hypothetical protein
MPPAGKKDDAEQKGASSAGDNAAAAPAPAAASGSSDPNSEEARAAAAAAKRKADKEKEERDEMTEEDRKLKESLELLVQVITEAVEPGKEVSQRTDTRRTQMHNANENEANCAMWSAVFESRCLCCVRLADSAALLSSVVCSLAVPRRMPKA